MQQGDVVDLSAPLGVDPARMSVELDIPVLCWREVAKRGVEAGLL